MLWGCVVVCMVMKKTKTLTALAKLNKEAMTLLAKSELDLKTAAFLADEVTNIIKKSEDESLTTDERDKIVAEMTALLKKLDYEKNQGELDDVEMKRIHHKLKTI